MSVLGGGAFAVHASQHGSAPVSGAEHHATARAAASGVQQLQHAPATITRR
jgi:hypothetical protein